MPLLRKQPDAALRTVLLTFRASPYRNLCSSKCIRVAAVAGKDDSYRHSFRIMLKVPRCERFTEPCATRRPCAPNKRRSFRGTSTEGSSAPSREWPAQKRRSVAREPLPMWSRARKLRERRRQRESLAQATKKRYQRSETWERGGARSQPTKVDRESTATIRLRNSRDTTPRSFAD